ncbi:cell division protein ZapA [Pseudidiomarina tainanensis]|jgi:cell division protein ZapA|uniref:Cell division protein ZapA n=2 Tax=Pseudidiomarina TaxID=2800384 RepID=A0A1I6HUE1_9GAMM|nr:MULTISPECIES: cell division protein ZapA [Pseudidiomarina]RZQ55382.1 cell division protein ZapA [Pseudidiomarina tainanensis]SFR58043.1 cell division protein ZapA [Pseudidiomarina maritima]
MSQRAMDIRLMERHYKVNCPPGQEVALQQAADRLNNKLETIRTNTKLSNPEQIAVMAGLNLCHEFAQDEKRQQQRIADLEEKLKLLQETLEQVMAEQRPGR